MGMSLNSHTRAYFYFKECMNASIEEFWILSLDAKLQVTAKEMLSRGTVNYCMIHPRDIIRFICRNNAVSFIIAHNHPSGDPLPSKADRQITKRIKQVGELVEIPMLDHLILTKNAFYSFTQKKTIKVKD